MKKTLFTLFTVINLVLLYCPAALALTEDEAAAAVDAQGKDAVSGNLFLWLLCAIAFLKVSTKLDGILHSLGIGVSRSPGSMLSETLLAFRGFEIGKAFMGLGAAKAAATTAATKNTPGNTYAGGLSGMVSRHVQQSTASSISGQSGGIGASLGGTMYHNSLGKDGGFASKVIGSIATGQTSGCITGDSAVEALNGHCVSLRHTDSGGGVRHSHKGWLPCQLRQLSGHQPRRRVLHPLRPLQPALGAGWRYGEKVRHHCQGRRYRRCDRKSPAYLCHYRRGICQSKRIFTLKYISRTL